MRNEMLNIISSTYNKYYYDWSSFQGVRILADARFYLILAFSAKNLGYVDRTFLTNKEALVVVVGEWENPLIIPRNIEHVYRIAWIYVQYM